MPRSRLLRRRRPAPRLTLERQPDAHPKSGLFAEPVRVTRLDVGAVEPHGDGQRVTFLVEVKDAEDRRCSDVSVEARVQAPGRVRTVQGTTDLLGRIRFRAAGGAGVYGIELTDVAAGGLAWDAAAGPRQASTEVD